MSKYGLKLFCVSALLVLVFLNASAGLKPGNKAPELDVSKWLKNGPVQLEKPQNVSHDIYYAIVFWGTWSPLSVEFFPQFSYFQEKYEKNGLMLVAISKEKEQQVIDFLDKQKNINFSVGVDNGGKTFVGYLDSATILPKVFIVDAKQKILWTGDLFDFESVMDSIVSGRFDLDDQKKITILRKELQNAIQMCVDTSICSIAEKIFAIDPRNNMAFRSCLFYYEKNNKYPDAITFMDERIKKDPEYTMLYFTKLELMVRGRVSKPEDYNKWVEAIITKYEKNPDVLNDVAWFAMESIPFGYINPEIPFKAAEKTLALIDSKTEKRKVSLYNSTYARACYVAGLMDKAVTYQGLACKDLTEDPKEAAKAAILLDFYKKAAALNKSKNGKK